MNIKTPILIIAGEPYSIFSEILSKTLKKNKFKNPLIVIASYNLLKKQIKFLRYRISINHIDKNFKDKELKLNKINLININFNFSKPFEKITSFSNEYNKKCFELGLNLIRKKKFLGLINGPISKKHLLKNKFSGITEFFAKKTNSKKFAMLIYNKNLAVSPITTHVPVKKISSLISRKKIINQVQLIKNFYKKRFNKNPTIAITGLNPHCEDYSENSKENKVIRPAINYLKKKYSKIYGPYPADSLFMSNNIKSFDVIIGMYHDQVLTPLKSIYNFNAINITLGLPFIRISPDHGPNEKMIGKNKSNPESLIEAIKFLDNS